MTYEEMAIARYEEAELVERFYLWPESFTVESMTKAYIENGVDYAVSGDQITRWRGSNE